MISWMSKTPLLIIYLIFMDFIFILQSILIKPISAIVCGIAALCNKNVGELNYLKMFEVYTYKVVFGMTS